MSQDEQSMGAENDFADELRGEPRRRTGARITESPISAGVVSGVIIGIVVLIVQRWSNSDSGQETAINETKIELTRLTGEVNGVKTQLQQLIAQPYERRDDHERDIQRIEARLTALERAAN